MKLSALMWTMLLAAPLMQGQGSATLPPTTGSAQFDVVSVKLNVSGSGHAHRHTSSSNADISTENVRVREMLAYAFEVAEDRIVGLEGPVSTARFDIVAKAGAAVNDTVKTMDAKVLDKLTREMTRAMLADRFNLAVHREKREMPVYVLEVAKGGSKVEPSTVKGAHVTGRRGSLVAKGVAMEELAEELSDNVGRIVLDRTGLAGTFDLTLHWTPDDGPPPMLNGVPDNSAPSIFTAIQEQLGLKLDKEKAMVDVVVVDRIAMPEEN